MVVGGIDGLKSGLDEDAESSIHRAAIDERDASFSAKASALVVDIDGETHELTGSAEVQNEKRRDLLCRIYAAETGLIEASN
jgi:hypothetical protein